MPIFLVSPISDQKLETISLCIFLSWYDSSIKRKQPPGWLRSKNIPDSLHWPFMLVCVCWGQDINYATFQVARAPRHSFADLNVVFSVLVQILQCFIDEVWAQYHHFNEACWWLFSSCTWDTGQVKKKKRNECRRVQRHYGQKWQFIFNRINKSIEPRFQTSPFKTTLNVLEWPNHSQDLNLI